VRPKVAAHYFDAFILHTVCATWATVGADHYARDTITLMNSASIPDAMARGEVLAKYGNRRTEAVHRDLADRQCPPALRTQT
jgi:hypothetical protein